MIHSKLYAVDVASVDGVYRATWQAWAASDDDAIDQAFAGLCADIFPDRHRADWLFNPSILIDNLCHPLFQSTS